MTQQLQKIFGTYSKYYDLIYDDKDYEEEALYINKLIKTYKKSAAKILDIGCGTGKHLIELSKLGYKGVGFDQSISMIDYANNNLKSLSSDIKNNLDFQVSDIKHFNCNQYFDVITCLFHVINYLHTENEYRSAFKNISLHLEKGSIFIFDFWYGPSVLKNGFETRVKEIENELFKITRIAKPSIDTIKDLVSVHYKLFTKNKFSNKLYEIEEYHNVRYLFLDKIQYYLNEFHLKIEHVSSWMSEQDIHSSPWAGVIVAKKI
tara:strand:+ start:849 stop:1634 length:786 start_codon:yes stop_codon:yes gene_type:complete